MAHVVNEVLPYCCLAAFVTGIVLAACELDQLRSFCHLRRQLLANRSARSIRGLARLPNHLQHPLP